MVIAFFVFREWFKELKTSQRKSRKPQLRNSLLNCFWSPFLINGVLCFIYIALK